jgi:hypothetical protein
MPFALSDFTKDAIQQHFRRKKLVWSEDYFIDTLISSKSRYDVYFASIALRDCGTEKCIASLRDKLHYSMQDVKCTALLTIAHIMREQETELYALCLLDAKYREPAYAMWAIQDAADERAVPAVLEYFRKNRSSIRRGKLLNGTLSKGLEYLSKYRKNNPDIEYLFQFTKEVWGNLTEGERTEIQKRIPDTVFWNV